MNTNAKFLKTEMDYWFKSRPLKVKYLGDWTKSLNEDELKMLFESYLKVGEGSANEMEYTKALAFMLVVSTTEQDIFENSLNEDLIVNKLKFIENAIKMELLLRHNILKHHPKLRLYSENMHPRVHELIAQHTNLAILRDL